MASLVIALGAAYAARSADGSDAPWYERVSVNGFLSTHYEYNINRPASGLNGYRVFDTDHAAFVWDVAELSAQKLASEPGDAGFRIDLTAGSTIPRVAASYGLFRDTTTGEAQDFDMQQVYASYVVPVGRGLRIDAGKHCTHTGYEVIEGYDGYNGNASRSFLFGYAIPFTHTGLRMAYPFSDRISAQLFLVNGWDNARDNNAAKSAGFQLAVMPAGSLSVFLNGLSGPEQAGDDTDRRSVGDVVVVWKPIERVTVGFNYDYGWEQGASASGGDAIWSGAAGYARYGLGKRFSLALRAEEFNDRDGARTGTDQQLREVTLTPEFRVTGAFIVRGDVRLDGSSENVFERRDGLTDAQSTVSVNLIWVY
jgi:hypothetical protein